MKKIALGVVAVFLFGAVSPAFANEDAKKKDFVKKEQLKTIAAMKSELQEIRKKDAKIFSMRKKYLHFLTDMADKKYELVEKWLAEYPQFADINTYYSFNPSVISSAIYFAGKLGDSRMFKLVLGKALEINRKFSDFKNFDLFYGVFQLVSANGYKNIVEIIMEHNPNIRPKISAFETAALNGHKELAEYFIRKDIRVLNGVVGSYSSSIRKESGSGHSTYLGNENLLPQVKEKGHTEVAKMIQGYVDDIKRQSFK